MTNTFTFTFLKAGKRVRDLARVKIFWYLSQPIFFSLPSLEAPKDWKIGTGISLGISKVAMYILFKILTDRPLGDPKEEEEEEEESSLCINIKRSRGSPGGPWLRLCAFTVEGLGSAPSQRYKIPHVAPQPEKARKKRCVVKQKKKQSKQPCLAHGTGFSSCRAHCQMKLKWFRN